MRNDQCHYYVSHAARCLDDRIRKLTMSTGREELENLGHEVDADDNYCYQNQMAGVGKSQK